MHWLDPLARRLLQATGHLPPHGVATKTPVGDRDEEEVELELLSLKLHQNPQLPLPDEASLRRAAQLGVRLDVNRASPRQWMQLPGMTWQRIEHLLYLQRRGVQIQDLGHLGQQLGLSQAVLRLWQPVLLFRPHGGGRHLPPLVDVNGASRQQLSTVPGFHGGHLNRLMRERQRGRFSSLADLQNRLQLPNSVMVTLAERLHCGHGPVAPELPPYSRSHDPASTVPP